MELQQVITQLRQGSKEAFEIIFKKYAPKIHAFTSRYFSDQEDCEEIVQEVFIRLWKNRESIGKTETFEGFLFTIAKNHIYNVLKRKAHQKAFKDYYLSQRPKASYSIDDEQNFTELFVVIKAITKSLPEQRRKVFIMSRFEGYSNKEIASQLGISVNTVETHVKLTLRKFREVLKQHQYLLHSIVLFITFQ